MPRRKKWRWINTDLQPTQGRKIELLADELEAIRLKDVEEISQTEAARIMGISQPTFHRVLKEGRKKVGIAVLENREVKVTGGEHTMRRSKCFGCGHEWSGPYGTGKPKSICPHCESMNTARADSEDRGPGRRGKGKGRRKGSGGRRYRGDG